MHVTNSFKKRFWWKFTEMKSQTEHLHDMENKFTAVQIGRGWKIEYAW